MFVLQLYEDASTVLDFTAKDRIVVSQYAYYSPTKADQKNPLVSGTDPKATSALAQFLYDVDDGRLFYDPDGTGILEAMHVLTLANKVALKASNILFEL